MEIIGHSEPLVGSGNQTEKVTFLRGALNPAGADTAVVETHMSMVFLTEDKAYKLKKSLRLPYLDFSSLAKREGACRAELRLNRRLAGDVYLDLMPLFRSPSGLSLSGPGQIADWLVVMRRLDPAWMLDRLIMDRRLSITALMRLCDGLIKFYRKAPRSSITGETHIARWRKYLAENKPVLFDRHFGLPKERLFRIDRALHRFLRECTDVISGRVRNGMIREGHGDMRPEHIWLGTPISIIDCLEFNAKLRMLDPLDEIAYLRVECERLGDRWAGKRIETIVSRALGSPPAAGLSDFYRCYRASLKARLALAHLLEPSPRTPEKWLPLAKIYLGIADQNARNLERMLECQKISQPFTAMRPLDGLRD